MLLPGRVNLADPYSLRRVPLSEPVATPGAFAGVTTTSSSPQYRRIVFRSTPVIFSICRYLRRVAHSRSKVAGARPPERIPPALLHQLFLHQDM